MTTIIPAAGFEPADPGLGPRSHWYRRRRAFVNVEGQREEHNSQADRRTGSIATSISVRISAASALHYINSQYHEGGGSPTCSPDRHFIFNVTCSKECFIAIAFQFCFRTAR
jgi:hypothetical protein